ncbi:MAG TPA: DUF885 domain-containing protein [Marmoricola sp.]|jgi:uncharacterized protein (DUF885 family)|nr:DUF885 domain-containing protein [Marmoricola sp.]
MNDSIAGLADDYFATYLSADPTEAHLLAHYEHAGRFEDPSRVEEDRRIAELSAMVDRADALDEGALDGQDRLTLQVLVSDARNRIGMLEGRFAEFSADPIFGPQKSLPLLAGMLAIPTAEVADAMVDKYQSVGAFYRALAQRQREGLAAGRVSPAFAVAATIAQIDEALAVPVDEDPLLGTTALPAGVDAEAWREAMITAITGSIRPGMAAYRDVLREEVLARARSDDRSGLSWLEGGEEDYDRTLRYFTTTGKSAAEIHEIGLEQVAGLAEEYRSLGPEVVGTADLQEIFEALRTDPALHFEHGDQLVEASEIAMQRAWDAIGDWFEVLPQAPCAVQATTTGAKAFYFPPATDGSRPGTFFVNVEDPEAWGTFELESMAFHEGIPGHHLQLAIAAELQDVPEFRKHIHNSAYAEGWGLYTERLADEMGLYSGPLDRMGIFSADSLRACRLVVDTGLHALGWSREQAVGYMVANSPMTEAICRPEVDRYILNPGQATSYMIGRLEILRMRAEARERQGSRFDVKAFHSAVLEVGSVPLDVLDEVVRSRTA